jgi:NTE family protein
MPADPKITDELAGLPTRQAAISDTQQQRLINWGYTICGTGLHKHVMPELQRGNCPIRQIR